ncbi:MAG: hypothetical protein ACYSW3_28405 [Planctomycetota bacterium]|jgi:hypothetical protein
MAQAELLREEGDIGAVSPIVQVMPQITGRDGILRFLALAKERGMSREKAAAYLKARGLLKPQYLTPQTPLEKINERVRQGSAVGGLRTVPLPEDESVPEDPQTVGLLDAALLRYTAQTIPTMLAPFDPQNLTFRSAEMGVDFALGAAGASRGENPIKPEWRRVAEEHVHAAEQDYLRGESPFVSKKGLKLLGTEIAIDPITWVPVAGALASVGTRLMSAAGRKMFTINFSDAVAKGFTEGLVDEMAEETAEFAVSLARQSAAKKAEADAARRIVDIVEGVEATGRKSVANVVAGAGDEATKVFSATDEANKLIDGEIAEVINTHFDDAMQMELFGETQLRLPNALDTAGPSGQASLGRKTAQDLNRLKDASAGAAKETVARLGKQRQILLGEIGERVSSGKQEAFRIGREQIKKEVAKAVEGFDNNTQNWVREAARKAVRDFYKNVMTSESVPSASEASAIAKMTAAQALEWGGCQGPRHWCCPAPVHYHRWSTGWPRWQEDAAWVLRCSFTGQVHSR